MEHQNLIAPGSSHELQVPATHARTRIDKYIGTQFPLYSRSFLSKLIEKDCVMVNGTAIDKPSFIIKPHDNIIVNFPAKQYYQQTDNYDPSVDVKIIHEHPHFLILNKPAHLLVHAPTVTSTSFTLVDWLISRYNDITDIGSIDRPGIVHRLDKDTSGVLIIPRTNYAHTQFSMFFKERTIAKTYYAIVHGHPAREGSVDFPIGRDPIARHKMMAITDPRTYRLHHVKTRHAQTHYTVIEYFKEHSLIEVKPVTGRTHQIRVHCAAIGHPIVGDAVYGKESPLLQRQALHAYQLSFIFDNQSYLFQAELPADFQQLLQKLRATESRK